MKSMHVSSASSVSTTALPEGYPTRLRGSAVKALTGLAILAALALTAAFWPVLACASGSAAAQDTSAHWPTVAQFIADFR